jgi:hypothetical protein
MTSARNGARDFDFLFGSWSVRHRRLTQRLAGSADWAEFKGESTTQPTLGGSGNIEDNLIHLPGGAFRAVALRSYDAATGNWAIWWLDGRSPHQLDVPVVGRFEGARGLFLADDTFEGRPIKVRFLWLRTDADHCRWEQAFSADAGASWETNWTMDFKRRF